MDVLEFIVSDGLIMIPFLIGFGHIIKTTGFIPNELIPVILLLTSFIITPWLLGGFSAINIVQSGLVASVAVTGNQIYKQIGYLKDGDKGDED